MVLSLSKTYASVGRKIPLALIGRMGGIEIAVNCDSAKSILEGTLGESVIARVQQQ